MQRLRRSPGEHRSAASDLCGTLGIAKDPVQSVVGSARYSSVVTVLWEPKQQGVLGSGPGFLHDAGC